MPDVIILRPQSSEYAPYYGKYIAAIPGEEAFAVLRDQIQETIRLLQSISEDRGSFRYAPGKWSIKEVVGHMCDTERIMAYRALRMARADATALASFEQDDYVNAANFDGRSLHSLTAEFQCIRAATLAFFGSLDEIALQRTGTASDLPFSVRALAYIIAGHERHHVRILEERYQLK
ncbi:MAG: DinB family protein [bacterium]